MRTALSLLLVAPVVAAAQGLSQAGLERDCLQRLRPIVPAGAQVLAVDFSALGQYANYYVVSYRFSRTLDTSRDRAACTYRRGGEWVSDDAASHKLARELARSGTRH